ncbi:MAG: flagellar biosynthesis protein FlhA [Thiohalospira sp.]|uniref:flagellar biosynthesis protein FlhA n=1 Tax=Thiohalospira sp. TaxID=3080549 RepID=UPI00398172E8
MAEPASTADNWLGSVGNIARNGLGVPILVMALLSMIVLPLPPFLLDTFFSFNIALSLVILLVAVYAMRPLDFAIFPAILLVATLFRLALNVASTRVVLLEGHTGTDAAGHVIESFGDFVVGGNYAVGLVVFVILVIINFVVVTKGAGRISEVTARFTLDAMPGKQMAIDADLNAGIIDQDQAKQRREEIASEAEFYGSMDGASKFVRGDAIAGILITAINILGGLAVGMGQHGLSIGDATTNYTLLAIGDGLVAQIPSLLLSTAAGIMVTRVSSPQEMSEEVIGQLLGNPRPVWVAAGLLAVMGVVPGMPNIAFLSLAGLTAGIAWGMGRRAAAEAAATAEAAAPAAEEAQPSTEPREVGWDDVMPVDTIGLEVGYRLIPMVDRNQGGQLMDRIKGVRKKLSQDLGFLIPPVHIRDNLDLQPSRYRVVLMGVTAGEATLHPDREMAINPGEVHGEIDGIEGQDPAFGLPAIWIDPARRDEAQGMGYTVVDANTVVATHLSQILQDHAHELIGHEEVQNLLDRLKESAPKLVENLVPDTISLGVLLRVLQNLLADGIPIRDMRTIAETLAQQGGRGQDADSLTAAVRVALRRLIFQHINGTSDEMPVITLDPQLEQLLQQSGQVAEGQEMTLEPGMAERLHGALAEKTQERELAGEPAVVLVSPAVRPLLARFVRPTIPGLNVLSYNEVPDNKQLRVVATVGAEG